MPKPSSPINYLGTIFGKLENDTCFWHNICFLPLLVSKNPSTSLVYTLDLKLGTQLDPKALSGEKIDGIKYLG